MQSKLVELGPSYSITDRASNIILHGKEFIDRIIISDWGGTIHILTFDHKFKQLKVVRENIQITERIPILSMDFVLDDNGVVDGNKLLLGDNEGGIWIYNLQENKTSLFGREIENRPVAKIITTTKGKIFTFTWDKTMTIWNADNKTESENHGIYTHSLPERFITAEYLDPYIVIIFGDNSICILNTETYMTGSALKKRNVGFNEPLSAICFEKDLSFIILGDIFGKIKVLKRNKSAASKEATFEKEYPPHIEYQSHFCELDNTKRALYPVLAISCDFKSREILSVGADGSIVNMNFETEEKVRNNQYTSFHERINTRIDNPITHLKCSRNQSTFMLIETEDYYMINDNSSKTGRKQSTLRVFQANTPKLEN